MTSPRDEIDDWLDRDVTPLYPPAGALHRIRRRARQRKTRQAMVAAAGCAVVLAGAAVTPQLIAAAHQPGHRNPPVAIQSTAPSVQPSGSHTAGTDVNKKTQIQQHTTLTNSWTRPPGHFRPTSVTFVGDGQGGVIGAVIGQAGPPCASSDCTSLAGTTNYGKTWYGVSAPYAPGPGGSAGVSQLRFASLSDGWAYGPALYETSHGGWPWRKEHTSGLRVIDIEAAPQYVANGVTMPARAFGVFGACTGNGPDYASNCTSFSLWTSVAGSTTWTAIHLPAQLTSTSSAAPQLVISGGTTAYLLTPSGHLLSGSTSGGAWQSVGQAPCKPGPVASGALTRASGSQAGGSPGPPAGSQSPGTSGTGSQAAGAQLAAGPKLLLACDRKAAGSTTQVAVYTSADGTRWQSAGASVTVPGSATSLTSAASGQAVLATTSGIEYSANGGSTWQAASFTSTGSGNTAPPAGGFSYVGMTTAKLGVAIATDASLGEVYVTSDGGQTWSAVPVSG